MKNIVANTIFDKVFPKERADCEMIIAKKFERDIKRIILDKVIDYRCYLKLSKQIIYYMVETKELYIAYKEDLTTRKQDIFSITKKEFELL